MGTPRTAKVLDEWFTIMLDGEPALGSFDTAEAAQSHIDVIGRGRVGKTTHWTTDQGDRFTTDALPEDRS